LISKEKLIELYSAMVMCRMIAERAGKLAREGNLSTGLDMGLGREATIAGIAIDLLPEDTLETTREAYASSFVKGMPLDALFASAVRSSNGNGHGSAREKHVESACAAAKTHKAAKDGRIAIAFCDAEQARPGMWRRSLSAASRHDLPVIFVRHEKTSAAKETKQKRASKRAALPEALEFGVPVIYVDGHDVVAVYRVASESIARARQRRGPTLIDCLADASAPLASAETALNGFSDPIATMESHLSAKGFLSRGLRKKITERLTPELDKATRALA